MKKSNWIGLAIAVLVDVFLLWLWFFLGFNQVDSPLDLVISIIWLVVIVAVVVGVNRLERQREKRLRTIYVSPTAVFNKERGLVSLGSAAVAPGVMERILKDMEYGFDLKEMPKPEEFDCRYVVQTDEYKAAGGETASRPGRGPLSRSTVRRATGRCRSPRAASWRPPSRKRRRSFPLAFLLALPPEAWSPSCSSRRKRIVPARLGCKSATMWR